MRTIKTDRLVLRPFKEEDLDAYCLMTTDSEVMNFLGGTLNREDTWRQMAMYIGHWHLRGYGLWAVEEKASGDFIGRLGLLNPEGWPGLEVGWAIARSRWGKGFATEGAKAALDYAFSVVGAEHVISIIEPHNQRSIKVAERIGERFERSMVFRGREVSIYGITKLR